MKKIIKEYILITIGLALVAAGFYFFLVPNDLAVGGVSGLAMIINWYMPGLTIGAIMLVLNVILFIIGFIFIGSSFGVKTIYSSLGLSGMIWAIREVLPNEWQYNKRFIFRTNIWNINWSSRNGYGV